MNDFQSKLKDKIKLYSNDQYLDGYIKNEFFTDDDDADIFLNINNEDELFDSRTINNQLDLNNSIYDFIENKSSMLDNDTCIDLHIVGIELDSKKQEKIRHIIKEHYAIELYKVQKEYIKYRNKIITLLIVGILSFCSYAFLYFFTTFNFFLEVFSFVFSFALWEACACMIYSFSEVKYEREAITQNLLMTVNFGEKDKTD